MKPEADGNKNIPTPSATVILLRGGADGPETLMLRRNSGRDPFAGAWVFPGGVIEAADGKVPSDPAWPASSRKAAVRELREETGLALASENLVPFAQWTSPDRMPRRYLTWFFLARAPTGAVRLNRREVDAHRWIVPRRVLAAHRSQKMTLFPPTWVSLHELASIDSVPQALKKYSRRKPAVFAPRLGRWGASTCFFYQEDAAYNDLDAERPGPRHRLRVQAGGWLYQRDGGHG